MWFYGCGPLTGHNFQVFEEVLYGLRETTSKLSLMDDRICDNFFALAELCEVSPEGSKFRPFCSMVGVLSSHYIVEFICLFVCLFV